MINHAKELNITAAELNEVGSPKPKVSLPSEPDYEMLMPNFDFLPTDLI